MSETPNNKHLNIENFVGEKTPYTDESVENATEAVDDIEAFNEKISDLIEGSDIPQEEKSEFRKELASLEEKTVSLKERFLKKLERVLEIGLTPIVKGVEAYGRNFGENRKKVDAVKFLLENLDCENKEELFEELRIKMEGNNMYSFALPAFPLNEKAVHASKYLKKKKVNSLYDLEDNIRELNFLYSLNNKGVSFEMAVALQKDSFARYNDDILNDTELIKKIKLLDETDLKYQVNEIASYKIQKMDMELVMLLAKNKYVKISFAESYHLDPETLAQYVTEDNLKSAKEFFGNDRKVKVNELISFCDQVSRLPAQVQDILKKQTKRNGRLTTFNEGSLKLLENVDKERLDLILKLTELGIVLDLWDASVAEIFELKTNIFKRYEALGLDALTPGDPYSSLSRMKNISTLSDEGFGLFKDVYEFEGGKDSWPQVGDVKNMCDALGRERGLRFCKFIKENNESQNLRYYLSESFDLSRMNSFFDMVEKEKDLDLMDFIKKTFGERYLVKVAMNSFDRELFLRNYESADPDSMSGFIAKDFCGCEHTFENFEIVREYLSRKGKTFDDLALENIFWTINNSAQPDIFLKPNSFPLTESMRKRAVTSLVEMKPVDVLHNYSFFDTEYLAFADNKQQVLDALFNKLIVAAPLELFDSTEFPFSEEQQEYMHIFKRILNSESKELKNLSDEIIPLLLKYRSIGKIEEALGKIEQVFLTNNIPMVGKQYKVFEILYGDYQLQHTISRSSVESLKKLNSATKQKLTIFKDLMRAHFASADSNLEQYLIVLRDGRDVLEKFENRDELTEAEKKSLKLFIKKINILSGHIGRGSTEIGDDISDEQMNLEIEQLRQSLDTGEGGNIIQRFEKFFLKRIGIETIDDGIEKMHQYKNNATNRNIETAKDGIKLKNGDLVKGVSSNYLDTYLDKGIYAPEFIGAETAEAKSLSRWGDMTPFDTDLIIVQGDTLTLEDNLHGGYGDIHLIIKEKEQFKEDELDIFYTGAIGKNHYGIRTGFGSTQIDAIVIRPEKIQDKGMDKIKYFIAKKGFYIPIYDAEGGLIFTKDDYDEYRKIFSGIGRYNGEQIEISSEWKTGEKAENIKSVAQTQENISSMERVRDEVQNKITTMLSAAGIKLHKGEYDDSLLGAIVSDTGSTGRGSALDEKFDFDFVVKLDDSDWDKVEDMITKVKEIFPVKDSYENHGMIMFRSQEVEIDGVKMDIDIGFNKKSDSEEFAAHDALKEKYRAIEQVGGKQALLDTLTNIRYAKKMLKGAECYKKGTMGENPQGGLGGIGVEYWIIQNGGDAVKAFKDFAKVAYVEKKLVPFEEFKAKYKIFSAGQNLRGSVKVENFTFNMTEEGYGKMAVLAQSFV